MGSSESRELLSIQLRAPYLVFLGNPEDFSAAKTGAGLVHWCPEKVLGQLRDRGCEVDLGVTDLSIEQAAAAGAGSLVIGVAPVGGQIPPQWWATIEAAVNAGLDVVSGLHQKLNDNQDMCERAAQKGVSLVDVRSPPASLPVGNNENRSGKRLLTVGTDCAVGKKYTALALARAMVNEGIDATFRATGQTGIMIAGEGIPLDAVVADFISGAAGLVSPANSPDHWDVIEGQGSLFHPGYAGVSLGLLHGSQPDAFVVCHEAGRLVSYEGHVLPGIGECIRSHLEMGRLTSPSVFCAGVSVNTTALSGLERERYLQKVREETGLPCVDPIIDGCDEMLTRIRQGLQTIV